MMNDTTGLEIKIGDEVVHVSYGSSGLYTRKLTVTGFTAKRVKLSDTMTYQGVSLVVITGRRDAE